MTGFADTGPPLPDPNDAARAAAGGKALVLLIEDDADQRAVASFIIRKAGHRLRAFADGASGLGAARLLKPDLIVCDIMMPGMSGYQVLEAVRADPALSLTPALLLSALSDRDHVRRGMTAGADDYLCKPYRPEELSLAVAAGLARGRRQREVLADRIAHALGHQKQALASIYEKQLEHELNARWTRSAESRDLRFTEAILVKGDLLCQGDAQSPAGGSLAQRLKRLRRAASDAMYLFGAERVLSHGTAFVSIFAASGSPAPSSELRAVRAAFALAAQVPGPDAISMGVHRGTLDVVRIDDALHGEGADALVPGPALSEVAAVRAAAAALRWRVAASGQVARSLAGQVATGESCATALGIRAVRILAPTPG